MITLRADNRTLIQNAKYSYLVDNYASGVSQVGIANIESFEADVFVVIGEIGDEKAELFRVGSVDSDGTIALETAAGSTAVTAYPHAESTRIWVIPYDTVRFYWTAATGTVADETPTYDATNPLTGYNEIEPSALFTTYSDSANSTGFGWFIFRNSITEEASQPSNPMPYGGFEANTVESIFSSFDSMLNTNQQRLVTMVDKFHWLNEALSIIKTKLNLTSMGYTMSPQKTLTVTAGTGEYILDNDFSDLVSITDTTSNPLPLPRLAPHEIDGYTGTDTNYYLRGRYIGLKPTPSQDTTYYYRYRAKAVRVTSLSTYIDLPDNAFYAIQDWMLHRAKQKFQDRAGAQDHMTAFTEAINLSMQSAVKRDADNDSWGIASYANT